MRLQAVAIFVAQDEFNGAILMGLKSTRFTEARTKLEVFGRGEGQNIPLLCQLGLNMAYTCKDFECRTKLIIANIL